MEGMQQYISTKGVIRWKDAADISNSSNALEYGAYRGLELFYFSFGVYGCVYLWVWRLRSMAWSQRRNEPKDAGKTRSVSSFVKDYRESQPHYRPVILWKMLWKNHKKIWYCSPGFLDPWYRGERRPFMAVLLLVYLAAAYWIDRISRIEIWSIREDQTNWNIHFQLSYRGCVQGFARNSWHRYLSCMLVKERRNCL